MLKQWSGSPLPFGVHRVHHPQFFFDLARMVESPLPFGIHRVHHMTLSDWLDGEGQLVSIAFRHSPRPPPYTKHRDEWLCVSSPLPFTASTTPSAYLPVPLFHA